MRRSTVLLLLLASQASAATRQWTVPSFERVRVTGPYDVRVATGAPLARASGERAALDAVTIEVQAGTLIVRPSRPTTGGSGDWGAVAVELATPALKGATLAGSGELRIAPLKAEEFALTVTGSGNATLESISADEAAIVAAGSGRASAAGKVGQARLQLTGSGSLEAAALAAADADITLNGSGTIAAAATRTAKVVALGAGDVTVAGGPRCTTRVGGSARVRCGSDQHQR